MNRLTGLKSVVNGNAKGQHLTKTGGLLLFTLVQSQFGCRSYSDAVDRVLVPNVVLVVSDNFASYGNVWNRFQSDAKADWECSDCPGSPAYVFLSTTADVPPAAIGMTYSLTVDDYALAGSMKAVNFFNSIVTGLCNMPLADCCSFTVADSCLYKTNEFWKRS
ncbi:unnamed protein product [Nippostrongylus brasiliensis]|uniref:Nicastrin n=1 Tax=Nippostrongylus brasiliensis TaxID=27835 RepID=A0A0N4YTJ0_NIPBR|nr:unnamed protein product [Nippostrongylus brasiliensis]